MRDFFCYNKVKIKCSLRSTLYTKKENIKAIMATIEAIKSIKAINASKAKKTYLK